MCAAQSSLACFQITSFLHWTMSSSHDVAQPTTKRAKLSRLLKFQSRLPAHSQALLEAIVKEIEAHGLPEVSSSKHQREARQQLLASFHGPLIREGTLTKADGNQVRVPHCSFLVYLSQLFHQGGSFHELLLSKHQKCPSSPERPWGLTLYADEIIPGNVLGRAERKCWALYATMDDFKHQLCHEAHYVRLQIQCGGHFGRRGFTMVLESIFLDPLVEPLGGFLLKDPSGNAAQDVRLHFHWRVMICDGAAHKQVWCTKGDGATKFCALCANVHSFTAKDHEDQEGQYTSTTR